MFLPTILHYSLKLHSFVMVTLLQTKKAVLTLSLLASKAVWYLLWSLLLCCGWITMATAAQSRSVDLAAEDLPALMRQQTSGDTLRLEGIPLDKGRPSVTFQLERFEVFSSDARIVVHGAGGETELPAPRNVYYRGHIENDLGSQVYLSLHAKGGLPDVRTLFVNPRNHLILRSFAGPGLHSPADLLQ